MTTDLTVRAARRISKHSLEFWLVIATTVAFAATLLPACQSGKIPDQDSYQAKLYVSRCGQCHQPYSPNLMTSAMWKVQVDAMRQRIQEAGLPTLSPHDREAILDYLTSHAGHQ